MLFHSWIFVVFFTVTYAVHLCLKRTRFWRHWLLFASYFFYGWWNPLYLLLILYSTALDYCVGLALSRSQRKKTWLTFSIVNNLLLLGFFKYGAFVSENLTALFDAWGIPLVVPVPGVLLPVGISFYTFQSMSYTIDLYRGKIERERNFVRFALFVSLFSQLVAGPIERAANLLPQLHRAPLIRNLDVSAGLSLFVVGLFKKIALADFLALYVDAAYVTPADANGLKLLLATYAFAWQIYFDFSGYTDMARGCARMMGIKLMVNFRNPYLATSLGEFWTRWHVSLSSWFTDYVYIPLGGNRRGALSTYRNMVLTMLISGLWHGAAWNFVLWGAMHAAARCLTRHLEQSSFYTNRVPTILKRLWVFHFICLAWVFFRANSVGDAVTVLKRIGTANIGDPEFPILAAFFCIAVCLYQLIDESRFQKILNGSAVRITVIVGMLVYLVFFTTSGYEPFIYFQF